MGLRIIERHLAPRRVLSAGERLQEVERESRAWFEAAGRMREHTEFMRHVESAYDRLRGAAGVGMDSVAASIGARILAGDNDGSGAPDQVENLRAVLYRIVKG